MTALDTNVLIYACDESDPSRPKTALDTIARSTDAVLLWQAAVEFVAASRKLSGQGFRAADAWDRLTEYMEIFPLILPAPTVLARAQELHMKQGWSFWDATLVAACVEAGVSTLYSEDLPGRRETPIEIVNPFAAWLRRDPVVPDDGDSWQAPVNPGNSVGRYTVTSLDDAGHLLGQLERGGLVEISVLRPGRRGPEQFAGTIQSR